MNLFDKGGEKLNKILVLENIFTYQVSSMHL